MKILGTMFAWVILLLLSAAPAFAAQAKEASGKGTIGIVCVDTAGGIHFWNAEVKGDFETCVDQVVDVWGAEESSSDAASSAKKLGFDDLIEGIESYRQSVARSKTQPQEKK